MTEARSATARRIVGLILSLVIVGPGHLVIGRARRAVGWNAVFVLSFVATLGAAFAGPGAMLAFAAGSGVVAFAQLVDLAFVEVKPRMRPVLLVPSVFAFFLTPGVAALVMRAFVVEAYHMPSESMIPALEERA